LSEAILIAALKERISSIIIFRHHSMEFYVSIISFGTNAGVNFDTLTFDFLRDYSSYAYGTSGFGGYNSNTDRASVSGSKLIYRATDGSITLDPIAQGKQVSEVLSGKLTSLQVVDHGASQLNIVFTSSTSPLPPKGPPEGISAAAFYNLVVKGDNEGLKNLILSGNDSISGTKFGDVIDGRGGNDTIYGYAGNDSLRGGAGNDKIDGGQGFDFIVGGTGADTLTGEAGGDTFVFETMKDSLPSAMDTITDYVLGPQGDIIDLHSIDANTKLAGDQAFNFIGKAGFSGKAGQLRTDIKDGATYVYGDVNGDKVADFAVKFHGVLSFDKGEFLL
jgi:serralysin